MSAQRDNRGDSASSVGRTQGANSARKLIMTVLSFTTQRPTPTIPELAEAVGVPQSTMYRYASLLRETGLIEPIGDSRYRLTDAVVGLAAAADAGRTSLIDAAGGHLAELRDAFDETVLLARRGGAHAYCIAREESSHPVRLQFAVGQAMPLHSGSAARILLAAMPERERTNYLEHQVASLSSGQQALLSETALARVRTDGWTQSREEVDTGIWGCAAAITQRGHVVAALGTAGPLSRLDEDRRRHIIDLVRRHAAAISTDLESH